MLLLTRTDNSYSLRTTTNPNRASTPAEDQALYSKPSISTQRPLPALCSTVSHARCARRPTFKIRVRRRAGFQPGDEVGDRIQEGVFVSDARAGHPVMSHVRVLGVSDMDLSPTGNMRLDLPPGTRKERGTQHGAKRRIPSPARTASAINRVSDMARSLIFAI